MNARENPEIHLFPGVFADIKRACEKDVVDLCGCPLREKMEKCERLVFKQI